MAWLILEAVLWTAASVVFMSLAEYAAHRYPMHSKWLASTFPALESTFERHVRLHHQRFYRHFSNDPDPAAKYINLELDPWHNTAMLSPVWLSLWWFSPLGGCILAATVWLHAVFWTWVHSEMHEPAGRWFSRTKWYRFLRDYHRTHHEHPAWNYNVVFPLMDFIFGTYLPPGREN